MRNWKYTLLTFTLISSMAVQGCTKNVDTVKLPPSYPSYNVLTIKVPEIKADIYKDMDTEKRKDFDETATEMIKAFSDAVQEYIKDKTTLKEIRVYPKEIANTQGNLILETTFTEIKPGQQGLRFVMTYIVGLPGFGKPTIEVECRLVDAYTGKKLDDMTAERDSSLRMGKFKGDLAIMYTQELGKECGEWIEGYMQTNLNE